MTLISSSTLLQAVQQNGPRDPAALLSEVNRGIKKILGQVDSRGDTPESDDGMDAAFFWFDDATRNLTFAGAKIPLLLLRPLDDEFEVIDGDRMGVGYVSSPLDFYWKNSVVNVDHGSLLFFTTDGLIDQIGGHKEIAYGKRRMRDSILAHRTATTEQINLALLSDFQAWQGDQPRRDDLTFFCFRP